MSKQFNRYKYLQATLVDLLGMAGRRPRLPLVISCSSRDELDAVCSAVSNLPFISVSPLVFFCFFTLCYGFSPQFHRNSEQFVNLLNPCHYNALMPAVVWMTLELLLGTWVSLKLICFAFYSWLVISQEASNDDTFLMDTFYQWSRTNIYKNGFTI